MTKEYMMLRPLILGLVALLMLACGSEGSTPTTADTPPPTAAYTPPPPQVQTYPSFAFTRPPTLDWQIFDSRVIVVATLQSVAASTFQSSTDPDRYLPMHVLSFEAGEYLKGTGPDEFSVEVPDPEKTYSTRADALAVATASLADRNSSYDSRSAVLFLNHAFTEAGGAVGQSSPSRFSLTMNDALDQDAFDYSVDTISRDWLPAKPSSGAGGATGQSSPSEYIDDGSATPPSTITLQAIKTRISEIQTELDAGDGSEAYYWCIDAKLKRPWWYIGQTENRFKTGQLPSGSSETTFGTRYRSSFGVTDPAYEDNELYFTSPEGVHDDLFKVVVVDDDEVVVNGYSNEFRNARPLTGGVYDLRLHADDKVYKPCNYRKTYETRGYTTWLVTVTAPAGTLHEAFFDPVTIGTSVGADATNGVLKPTSFTVGETATQMTGLKWENNRAVLTLSPHVSLDHYALDFIELDGTISLTLQTKDATVDASAGTHTWSVTDQPWHDGDKLMLRMREVPSPPSFASDTYNFTVAENTSSFTVIGTALATDPNEGDEVLHTITAGNDGSKFQIDGWAGFIMLWGSLDYETKSSYTLTVKADDGNGGTDTATVNITVTDVAE